MNIALWWILLFTTLALTFAPVIAEVEGTQQEQDNANSQLFNGNIDGSGEDEETMKRVFVKYKEGSHDSCLQTLRTTTKLLDPSNPTTMHYDLRDFNSFVVSAPEKDLEFLKQHELVLDVVEDSVRRPMFLRDSIKPYNQGYLRQNDAWRRRQSIPYGVQLVQATQAWEQNVRGEGIKVCVLDTGLDRSHDDLISDHMNGYEYGSDWGYDLIGHGTHVSGIIVAADNGIGVIGVAPDAEIYTVKVFLDNGAFDGGFIFSSGLIQAASKCVEGGANIISMSLGGPIWNPFEFQVFNQLLEDYGVISIAAAGNDGGTMLQYPASYDGVISVGAVDKDKQLANFSQVNRHVDLVAPGVDILSLLPINGDCAICQELLMDNGYGEISGTSMATPHVAGVAALLWSFKPNATASEIIMAMTNGAEDLGPVGADRAYGHGLVSTVKSLQYLEEGLYEESAASSLLQRGEICESNQDCASGACTRMLLLFWIRRCE